jgi:hypothetical protein
MLLRSSPSACTSRAAFVVSSKIGFLRAIAVASRAAMSSGVTPSSPNVSARNRICELRE